MNPQEKLSTLWIVVMLNIVFADILSFISPDFMAGLVATGTVEGNVISQELLLVFAILLEIPIAMIFLSRTLPAKTNRIANLIAGVLTLVFVIGGGSLSPHYLFFASVEVLCLGLIMKSALQLPSD